MDKIIKFLCKIEISDCISIINIVITTTIGVILIVVVQNRMTNNRASKDFFIGENNNLRRKYAIFFQKLFLSKISSKQIIEWFKIMTLNIDTYKITVESEFQIDCNLLDLNNEFKKYLTKLDSFNESYEKEYFSLTQETKDKVLGYHKKIILLISLNIIKLNRAKRKKHFHAKS